MSVRKSRLTITVDPHVSAYAQRLVETGQAASVSAVFNEAIAEKALRDRRRRSLWKATSERASSDRIARMMAYIDEQIAGE
jgi:Arc/MetJ-type ribon-helix-helix transcriptional regulator